MGKFISIGSCPICLEWKELVVDHDHQSGLIRGHICQDCNRGLGCFRDEVQRLMRAGEYLWTCSPSGSYEDYDRDRRKAYQKRRYSTDTSFRAGQIASSRRRRQADPEAYNAYMREYRRKNPRDRRAVA